MSSQAFVRSARAEDVPTVVRVQVAAWQAAYGESIPRHVMSELTSDDAAEQFQRQWQQAVTSPPTSRHHLLVATDDRLVVGFTALGPAEDPDRWPGTDAEIYALHVDPERVGQGHGSRLLNAAVDHLVDDGFSAAYIWVPQDDNALRRFVEASGWRPDGATRELDLGDGMAMVRMHAAIGD